MHFFKRDSSEQIPAQKKKKSRARYTNNPSIHRQGHLLSQKPCLLNDSSRVQKIKVKLKGLEVWTVGKIRKNFSTQLLLCKTCLRRGRIIVLKHSTPSQESRSFARNCISETVLSAAVLGSIDTLTLWQNF